MLTVDEHVDAVYQILRADPLFDEELPFPGFRELLEKVLADRRPSAGTLPWLLLPILTCEALGGKIRQAQQAAAALEIGRIAAGILDEWQDGDTDDALWRTLGAERAVNLAYGLASLSYQVLEGFADLGMPMPLIHSIYREFHRASLHMSAGQDADLAGNLDLDEYEQVAGAKSGSLFRLGCRAGAIVADAPPDVVDQYGEFGYNLGVVAQMWNDLEGLAGSGGKGDAEQQRSLPFVATRAIGEGEPALLAAGQGAGPLYTLVRLQVFYGRAAEALARCPKAGRLSLFLKIYSTGPLVEKAQRTVGHGEEDDAG